MEVTLNDFSFSYSASHPAALSQLNAVIPSGSCCAILGPTGSGKTTLLLAISGALGEHHPSGNGEGTISVGTNIFRPMPDKILFPKVGLCLQESQIMVSGLRETVFDEIKFSLENIPGGESHEERVKSVMKGVGIFHLAERRPFTLSGGELQRVALASLLVAEPSVLLLDEPGNSLDGDGITKVVRLLRRLRQRTTVIFSDYQVDLAILVADSILLLDGGKLVFFGEKKDFMSQLVRFESLLPVDHWLAISDRLSRGDEFPQSLVDRFLESE